MFVLKILLKKDLSSYLMVPTSFKLKLIFRFIDLLEIVKSWEVIERGGVDWLAFL
jgi:hypothetical protein